MKAYSPEEKDKIKFRFAVALFKALEDARLNPSKLALEAGTEKAHMQRAANGKINPTLTTQMAITEGLGISYTQLAEYYDGVTPSDEKRFAVYQKKQQALKAHNKKKNPPLEKGK